MVLHEYKKWNCLLSVLVSKGLCDQIIVETFEGCSNTLSVTDMFIWSTTHKEHTMYILDRINKLEDRTITWKYSMVFNCSKCRMLQENDQFRKYFLSLLLP